MCFHAQCASVEMTVSVLGVRFGHSGFVATEKKTGVLINE